MIIKNDLQELGIEIVENIELEEEQIIANYADSLFINREKKILNENEFAKCFTEINKLQYSNGLFYTNTGRKTEDMIAQDIWRSLDALSISTNVDNKTKKLLGAVKLCSTIEKLKVSENIIPFANGDLDVSKKVFYKGRYNPSPYRLHVSLEDDFPDTPNFRKWLTDLMSHDDMLVFQEYLGYCLVPNTKAQKALFLVGEGGAGKSVLGVILEAILGDAMISTPNTQEFMQDKFKLPELENKLVLYDDDLDNAALSSTGLYKKLITNNLSITADRKYGHPFKFQPFVRLVSCCNEMLTSAYDQTNGFYRRLLPIVIKPKRADFKPDPQFYDKIRKEANGIVGFALEGLFRLINRGWELAESSSTKDYLNDKKAIGNHFPDFLETVFDYEDNAVVSSADLKRVYEVWCSKNACVPRKDRALQTYLIDNSEKLNIKYSTNVMVNNTRLRGYKGLKIKQEWHTLP